jgi:hypothetical protein
VDVEVLVREDKVTRKKGMVDITFWYTVFIE